MLISNLQTKFKRSVPFKRYFKKLFLPLQRTVTVRGRTSRGLLLSPDVPATDYYYKQDFAYYCPRTQFAEGLLHLQAKVTWLGHDR